MSSLQILLLKVLTVISRLQRSLLKVNFPVIACHFHVVTFSSTSVGVCKHQRPSCGCYRSTVTFAVLNSSFLVIHYRTLFVTNISFPISLPYLHIFVIIIKDFAFKIVWTSIKDSSSCSDSWDFSYLELDSTVQMTFSGTRVQFFTNWTSPSAFRRPNPKREFTLSPLALVFQPVLWPRGAHSLLNTTACCMSLQVKSGLK